MSAASYRYIFRTTVLLFGSMVKDEDEMHTLQQ